MIDPVLGLSAGAFPARRTVSMLMPASPKANPAAAEKRELTVGDPPAARADPNVRRGMLEAGAAQAEAPEPATPPDAERGEARELAYPGATASEQQRAREGFAQRLSAYLQRGRARIVVTDNLHTMVSVKRGHGVFTFRIHHMFLTAPPRIARALARYAERHDAASAKVVREYIEHHELLIRVRAEPRAIACDVSGRHHDLQSIFDEVNEDYFDGAIQARITWGPRARRKKSRESIKLGSYTVEDALIRIHPVLDAEDVPRFFVAWIIYHEMLHEIHDMPVVDGRRVYHTAQFRRAEAQFDEYTEAVLWERRNLHRLLER